MMVILRHNWSKNQEARIYLNMQYWSGEFNYKELALYLGVIKVTAMRMLKGGPVGDKSVARALVLGQPKRLTFEDLFVVRMDEAIGDEMLNGITPAFYPETFHEALQEGFPLSEPDADVPEPHVKFHRGGLKFPVMAHTEDGTIYILRYGWQDQNVELVIRHRFGASRIDYPMTGVITKETIARVRERRARKAEQAEQEEQDS